MILKHQKACFGASPDSVLEVKCPFCAQGKGLKEVVESNKQFCLIKDSEANMMLNRKHSYYYQCQIQLNVTDTSYCDFIVWSETGDLFCERILPDSSFILEQLHLA